LPPDVSAIQIEPVPVGIGPRRRTPKEFTEEDVRQRFENRGGRAFQQIRDPHVDSAVFQPDKAVGVRKPAEIDPDRGKTSAGFQFPENSGVDFLRSLKKERALNSGDG
jgi:hypothetical protein